MLVEFVLACLLALGLQRLPKGSWSKRGRRTRHAPDVRLRLGGCTIGRVPCPPCTAVYTVLLSLVLRSRAMQPEGALRGELL